MAGNDYLTPIPRKTQTYIQSEKDSQTGLLLLPLDGEGGGEFHRLTEKAKTKLWSSMQVNQKLLSENISKLKRDQQQKIIDNG